MSTTTSAYTATRMLLDSRDGQPAAIWHDNGRTIGRLARTAGVRVVLAEPGEYSPFVDVRIDKQNRGKTGLTMRQFLIGQFFDIRDIEVQRTQLDY